MVHSLIFLWRRTKPEKIFREIKSNRDDEFMGICWIHRICVDFLNYTENFVKSSHLFYRRITLLLINLTIDLILTAREWTAIVFFPWNWIEVSQCGNCCDLVSHIFGKNFVKVTFLLKKLLKSWFDEIFFRWD